MFARYKTLFIIIVIIVNICLAVGIYLNSHQNQLAIDGINTTINTADETGERPGQEQEYSKIEEPKKGILHSLSVLKAKIGLMTGHNPLMTDDDKITETIERKLDTKVDKKDIAKVASIILKKLDADEISYLYRVGTKDNPSSEELKKAKSILSDKLDREEIQTIKKVALKYGKDLKTLDI